MKATHESILGELLIERGVSNRQLAVALDTSESTVSRWRRGLRPSEPFRRKITRELKLTAEELERLGWTEKETAGV